jgi:hypothetical protein
MPPETIETIKTIDREELARVSGGSRVTSRSGSDGQLTAMLQQITSSISDLANSRNQSDPTQMLLMMMMMGGMGGGGGGGVMAAAPAGSPPVINVDTSVLGGNRGGFFGGGGCCPPCGSKKGW